MGKLIGFLLAKLSMITTEGHNAYTYEWSRGYRKGYEQAVQDIINYSEDSN